jgi:hypothetical protein
LPFKEELSPAEKLFDMIDKVVIVKGRLSTDPIIWEFHIMGKVIKIEASVLENPKAFRSQYLSIFDRPAPLIKTNAWINLLDNLADEENNKVEYQEALEESNNEFIARQIFEIVCEREISDDAEEALSGLSLYEYELKEGNDKKIYFCLPSRVLIGEILGGTGYKITPKDLSQAMTELGFKKEGTHRVWYNGDQKRSWCFIPEVVMKEKGE